MVSSLMAVMPPPSVSVRMKSVIVGFVCHTKGKKAKRNFFVADSDHFPRYVERELVVTIERNRDISDIN